MDTLTHRHRLTRQRGAVLDAVREARAHVDANFVYEVVRKEIPRISLGTVYRALGTLAESGLVHEIDSGSGPSLYDGNVSPHQHIICRKCGSVRDLDFEIPRAPLSRQLRAAGSISTGSAKTAPDKAGHPGAYQVTRTR